MSRLAFGRSYFRARGSPAWPTRGDELFCGLTEKEILWLQSGVVKPFEMPARRKPKRTPAKVARARELRWEKKFVALPAVEKRGLGERRRGAVARRAARHRGAPRAPQPPRALVCGGLHLRSDALPAGRLAADRHVARCASADRKFVSRRRYLQRRSQGVNQQPVERASKLPALNLGAKRSSFAKPWDPFGGAGPSKSADVPRDACLVLALRSLGYRVPFSGPGPFRALEHGCPMLRPFGKGLKPVSAADVEAGDFVVWIAGHFVGLRIDERVTVYDGAAPAQEVSLSEINALGDALFFEVVDSGRSGFGSSGPSGGAGPSERRLSVEQLETIERNRALAVARRSLRHSSAVDRSRVDDQLTPGQLRQIAENREFANLVRSASGGLSIPALPEGCLPPAAPATPLDFLKYAVEAPRDLLLERCNPHERDRRLAFDSPSHTYYVDGVATLGSVTGLVHRFAAEFHADRVIAGMQRSPRWPRPGYLRQAISPSTVSGLRSAPSGDRLAALLEQADKDEAAICQAAQQLARAEPKLRYLIDELSLTAEEIKAKWEANRIEAANRGTWMHLNFELHLNRVRVLWKSDEMRLFLRFIATLKGLTAFRTEWMIFGEEERLAGSIDFVATDSAGELTLFDWKRSRGLQNKYPGHGLCHAIRQMLPPLEHLADCSGVHYRLQPSSFVNMVALGCVSNRSQLQFRSAY